MINLLLTIILSTLFCLGWRIVTSEGNLLYFLRKPLESDLENLEMNEELYERYKNPMVFNRITKLKRRINIAKPLILCITCFGSFWGGAVYISLNGIDINHIPHLLINSISVSFLNTIFWIKYEKTKQQ